MNKSAVYVTQVFPEPHPYADKLEVIHDYGLQYIVPKGEFHAGDIAVIIQEGMIVPQTAEFEFLRPHKFIVKAMKLRGLISNGIVVHAKSNWRVGMDVAEEMGIKKYEPPIPVKMEIDSISDIPGFYRYPNIERFERYKNLFKEDDIVAITEKLHGTNWRAGLINGNFCVGGRTRCKDTEGTNIYSSIAREYNIKSILQHIITEVKCQSVILYGEVFGRKIQDLHYGFSKPVLNVFDIRIDGKFLNFKEFITICDKFNLSYVPVLYTGTWHDNLVSLAYGNSDYGHNLREGIVIKSYVEQFHEDIGRKILKLRSEDYITRKRGTEYH